MAGAPARVRPRSAGRVLGRDTVRLTSFNYRPGPGLVNECTKYRHTLSDLFTVCSAGAQWCQSARVLELTPGDFHFYRVHETKKVAIKSVRARHTHIFPVPTLLQHAYSTRGTGRASKACPWLADGQAWPSNCHPLRSATQGDTRACSIKRGAQPARPTELPHAPPAASPSPFVL